MSYFFHIFQPDVLIITHINEQSIEMTTIVKWCTEKKHTKKVKAKIINKGKNK